MAQNPEQNVKLEG